MEKSVVVTGAAGGIGAACVARLRQDGWFPIATDLDEATVRDVIGDAPGLGVGLDVTDPAAVGALAETIGTACPPLGALVTCAALVPSPMPARFLSLDEWTRAHDVALKGTLICAQAFGGMMIDDCGGSIVMIGSLSAVAPMPLPAYGPAKAAVINLAEVLAAEWGAMDVRVNCVSPGPTRTPVIERSYERGERDPDRMAAQTALGRLVMPADVANAVAFLISEQARAITGINLVVDAGTRVALPRALFPGTGVEHERKSAS